MDIDRNSNRTLWKQVRAALENEIRTGALAPGDLLPSESRLSRRFAVNRHTVRRALQGMQEDGLIRTQKGLGSLVLSPTLNYPLTERTRFSEIATPPQTKAKSRLLRSEVLHASVAVAGRLGLHTGEEVIRMEMTGEAAGRCLFVSTGYFPLGGMVELVDAFEETQSLTQAFLRCGIGDYLRSFSRISTRPADPMECRHLGLARRQPVLVVEYVNVDLSGRPIEYGVTRFAGDKVELHVDGPGGRPGFTAKGRDPWEGILRAAR